MTETQRTRTVGIVALILGALLTLALQRLGIDASDDQVRAAATDAAEAIVPDVDDDTDSGG